MSSWSKMRPEIKEQWVAALRSGDYTQGRDRLLRDEFGTKSYCCLGVLVDLAVKSDCPGIEEVGENGHAIFKSLEPNGSTWHFETSVLPAAVRKWAGLHEHDANPLVILESGTVTSLTAMNDSHHATFAEIADAIERSL